MDKILHGLMIDGGATVSGSYYDPRNYGDKTRTGANIALACAAATNGIVVLAGGTYTVSSSVDFLNTPLLIMPGCYLIINSGVDITNVNIYGKPDHLIISCAEADVPVLYNKTIMPIWFGDSLNKCFAASPATGAEILLEEKTYQPVSLTYNRGNIKITGKKTPTYNQYLSCLENGSIIKGPLRFSYSNIELSGFGVDSGSDVCDELYDGDPVDGLVVANSGFVVGIPVIKGLKISNVTTLCKAYDAWAHAMLIENVDGAQISNIIVRYGVHGLALKIANSTVSNVVAYANGFNGMIIKNNDYAPCHNVALSNIVVNGSDAEVPSFGVVFDNVEATDSDLSGISIVGLSVENTPSGVYFKNSAGNAICNIKIVGDTYYNVTSKYAYDDTVPIDFSTIYVEGEYLWSDPTRLTINKFLEIHGNIDVYDSIMLRYNMVIRNKVDTAWLPLLSRAEISSEYVRDVANIGGISSTGLFWNSGSMVVGNPTSGNRGYGTINAHAVYDDNVLLT